MYKPLVSADQMRRADKNAIEKYKIDELLLIENAALALLDECPKVRTARVFCGVGNNGADGFALARHLYLKGVDTEIISLGNPSHKNFEICKSLGMKIYSGENFPDKEAELYVDALFGTGLSRDIEGQAKEIILYINSKNGFKLSADIPSGINADTGEVMGVSVCADKTVTFAWAKKGLYQYPGRDFAGEIVVKDISIPKFCLDDVNTFLVSDVRLPKRKNDSNKGDFGKVFCLCGSEGMEGAAYMSVKAAVKSGTGLVSLAVHEKIYKKLALKIPECMTVSYKDKEDGERIIKEKSRWADTLLVGPGIGNTEESAYLVREAVKAFRGKNIIIDADGLNVLKDSPEYFKDTVITPHPGEMARLLNCDISKVQKDRLGCSMAFARKYGCDVVLKGASTVTAYKDGICHVNSTGNPGMANGGSGDVLSGLVASFMAQKIKDAPTLAVYLHGLAGDMCREKLTENSMSATDIIKMIPSSMKKIINV